MADLRRCIGSERFGISAHEAPVTDFRAQPSQKDGLGRMCTTHWNQYTTELRKAALARKATEGDLAIAEPSAQPEPAARVATKRAARGAAAKPEPIRTRPARGRKTEGEEVVEAVEPAIAPEPANLEEASIA